MLLYIVIQPPSNCLWQRSYYLYSFPLSAVGPDWGNGMGEQELYLTYLQAETMFVSLAQTFLPLRMVFARQCRNGSHFSNIPPIFPSPALFSPLVQPTPSDALFGAIFPPASPSKFLHMQGVKWLWHSQGMHIHHFSATQWT